VELHLETVRNLTIDEGNVSNITAEIFLGSYPLSWLHSHLY